MSEPHQSEVDKNFAAFQELLPRLLGEQPGRWALMHDGEVVDFYDTLRDAETAAAAQFSDGVYSVQQVTDAVVDLGWFSHAVPNR